jgi:hypothetical protein
MPEEIKITADGLVDTVKNLIHEGNVRHIAIRDPQGKTVLEFPVNVGVIGLVLAPMIAGVAAIAVVAADFTIVVTRNDEPAPPSAG